MGFNIGTFDRKYVKKMKKLAIILSLVFFAALTVSGEHGSAKKARNLFNIVTFKNAPCRSSSSISSGDFRNGTCYTKSECAAKGGSQAGSCASGFGVCCIFTISSSGGTVSQNCTYIRNPNFPSAYTTTSAGQVSYTVTKCSSDVCSLRLDFEQFTIQGTGNTVEAATDAAGAFSADTGGGCLDELSITSTNGNPYPQICGQNSGQHVYVDMGRSASDTASLNFAFTGTSNNRQWEIKVTQIPCSASYREPEGCFQYQTGLTGVIKTFNFDDSADNHLGNQNYDVCIRQEEGFCCIEYTVCDEPNAFTLGNVDDKASTDHTCATIDYITIAGSAGECDQSGNMPVTRTEYCNGRLNPQKDETTNVPICDCTAPFRVGIHTDSISEKGAGINGDKINRGICLEWRQIACNN